jgi:hypothetical protein
VPYIVRGGAVDRLRDTFFLVRHLFPKAIRKRIGNIAIQGLPSRRFMQTDVLPAIAAAGCKRMLFVGAQPYNLPFYRACVAHLTFDVVIYNGILGFGINTVPDALKALESMSKIAEPSALLLIGWNPGLTSDAEITVMRPRLTPAMLGALPQDVLFAARGIQKHPHRYEVFRFRPAKTA